MAENLTPKNAAAFERVVHAFAKDKEVAPPGPGTKFGDRRCLKVNGRIFALMSSTGEFVVKLPAQRVRELRADGTGVAFDPGHGRLMKQWLVVTAGQSTWMRLAKEARAFCDA